MLTAFRSTGPCRPALTGNADVKMGQICLSWSMECTGGSSLTSCGVQRHSRSGTIQEIRQYGAADKECSANGLNYTYCDSNITFGSSVDVTYTFEARNALGSAVSLPYSPSYIRKCRKNAPFTCIQGINILIKGCFFKGDFGIDWTVSVRWTVRLSDSLAWLTTCWNSCSLESSADANHIILWVLYFLLFL